MTRTKLILCAALAACVWLAACGPTWYSITLTPKGPVMERKITQRFGPEELDRVAMIYSQEIDAETIAKFEKSSVEKISLTGTFGVNMPADSHNRGVYVYCDSPLGSAAVYTERFGGRYDLAAMLREQEEAFNAFWDVLLLHLDALVGDSADYAALRSFADTTMRADMWDLVLELTMSDLGEDATRNLSGLDEMPDDASDKIMRALHFLDVRGYITLQEAFDITTGEFDDGEWYPFAVKTLGQSVGRRMGMDDGAMPAAFEALMDYTEEQLEEEVDRIRANDERIVDILAQFGDDLDSVSADLDGIIVVEPSVSIEPLVNRAFLFDFDLLDFGGEARDVTLYIPVKPYLTNGAWIEGDESETSEEQSHIEWQYPLASIAPGGDLAQVIYAFWAEPAEDYQVEHFGLRVLDDSSLADQCRWRQLLGPSLRKEWDTFIEGLRPGPDLAATLRGFLFSIEEPLESDDPNASRSRIAGPIVSHLASNLPSDQSRD